MQCGYRGSAACLKRAVARGSALANSLPCRFASVFASFLAVLLIVSALVRASRKDLNREIAAQPPYYLLFM